MLGTAVFVLAVLGLIRTLRRQVTVAEPAVLGTVLMAFMDIGAMNALFAKGDGKGTYPTYPRSEGTGDSTFSVPAASGCTDDNTVNTLLGLPSPSGANNLVLLDAGSALALPNATLSGIQWSTAWHTTFGGSPPTTTTTTTSTTTTTT